MIDMQKYKDFLADIVTYIDDNRIYTDDLRCLAWGTDASFYRILPKIVVRAKNRTEVAKLLQSASNFNVPVTFRAAGTSLSGQSISDSVLIVAGKNWEDFEIAADAQTITLQPGIIGDRVNQLLAPYNRMFTPDPASKKSAMVGGIIINNASGMNCGTHANSDRMLLSMGIILADGTMLDTGNADSRRIFAEQHPDIIREIEVLRDEIRADKELSERIAYKYSIKNVTGLNLRPFIAYDDPFDIIAHCMVGSEGTLGFMYSATLKTAPVLPFAASAMLYFEDMSEACRAVVALKKANAVDSCEMLDKKSLASVNDTTGECLTALLLDTKADSEQHLQENIQAITDVLNNFKLFKPVEFSSDPDICNKWWAIRSGVFPAVGGTRPLGTTSLIEDVAFHIDDLPAATADLAQLLVDCGYDDACIYGHALEGNYHFVIAQSFESEADVEKYRHLMLEVEKLVIDKYDGSLKAEHGTGRNMAPFVEKEWGAKAYAIMRRLKGIMDPQNILNPGVIFNDDPDCYIKNMKPLPLTNDHVDRCIECGFCEVNCVSCGFTISARQRIIVQREISRLRTSHENDDRLHRLEKQFKYLGNKTCAGDGLCSTSCPMNINTADMIHDLRRDALPRTSSVYKFGKWSAEHLSTVESCLRPVLNIANAAHSIFGDKIVNATGRTLNNIGLPLWSASLPSAANPKIVQNHLPRKVVYFPSCINQTFGASKEDKHRVLPLVQVMVQLCNKAGYEVIFPENMQSLCCGMIWESKGMPEIANSKTAELERALLIASDNGRIPVLCDQSPCLHRMRSHISSLKLYEPAEFIENFLVPYLDFKPIDEPISVHITCSTRHMNLANTIVALAQRCSRNVIVPTEIGCCGFAGDKGFLVPELNAWALRKLKPQLVANSVHRGFSNSRTCEIGLTNNSGIPYKSIAYLVNEVTTAKTFNR
jgi:D-lactate dehydrogenase